MTFSIAAKCAETGQFGVAVSTKLLCVGALCPFVKAGVGAISSQSFVNPYIGVHGLRYLEEGMDAESAMRRLAEEDEGRGLRQFTVVDREGRSAAFSGDDCVQWFGHRTGSDYAAAGNMLTGADVVDGIAESFESTTGQPFGERLMQALEAGQAPGGDKRGRQSAAMVIYSTEEYPLVDLRIDDHTDPVAELRRLWGLYNDQLAGVMSMLPTKEHPFGLFDMDQIREHLPE